MLQGPMSDLLTLPIKYPGNDLMHSPIPMTMIEPTAWKIEDIPVAQMPISLILVSPNGDAQATDLDGLVASIRSKGVLQPLIVAPDGRLLAGRRRLEAARRAGLEQVPVRVCEVTSERSAIEIGLVENVERTDLDPLTRAKAYRALIDQGASVEEVADLVGQGTRHVYQLLQLFDLHPQVQQAVHTRVLSFADARALVLLEQADQVAVFEEIQVAAKSKPLTSRQVKARVDARRVMRLVQENAKRSEQAQKGNESRSADSPQDNAPVSVTLDYAVLFETTETDSVPQPEPVRTPLADLDQLIAEMVAAAQGEDQVRVWARRLSHILGMWRDADAEREKGNGKKKSASAVQDRLL
ncbi:Chromosome-partitioning protein Spo0J [Anaerolineae bacterium]|nr:Chromosome-partitioning protein Spo0J [Anaerolineae bacterium]